jgi:hypothetical protein
MLDRRQFVDKMLRFLKDGRVNAIARRIDYNYFNYCSTCELKYPKEILRCKDCKQKIRVKPWHRSKILDSKRI